MTHRKTHTKRARKTTRKASKTKHRSACSRELSARAKRQKRSTRTGRFT